MNKRIVMAGLLLMTLPAWISKAESQPQQMKNDKTACVKHPWAGKRVGFIGDSITDPNCYGNNIKKFWDFLKEWLDITPYVYGISGKQWDDADDQADKLKAEHGNEVDAILVFLGTKDRKSVV